MKKIIVVSTLIMVILSSCSTQKQVSSYSDDVYANPTEDRIEEAKAKAIAQQQKDAQDKRYSDSLTAIRKEQQQKDDANPYYKDREFKYDDYYDYEYATRVRRFNNRIDGLSYYDNYYTNSYWYNQNPYNYGVSVYNGYSWWGSGYNNYSYSPSINFYNSWGWNSCPNYGYNGYNPYFNNFSNGFNFGYNLGYNNGWNNGWNGYPYLGYNIGFGGYNPYGFNPYGYNGFNNPYNNPYNNGWGYFNSFDNNSSYSYGPRTSHGGGNSRRTTNPGVRNSADDTYYNKLVTSVNQQQEQAVKFNPVRSARTVNEGSGRNVENTSHTGGIKDNSTVSPPRTIGKGETTPSRGETLPGRPNIQTAEPVKHNTGGVRDGNSEPTRPVREINNRQETAPVFDNQRQQSSPSPSKPSNNSESAPSNGGRRPR